MELTELGLRPGRVIESEYATRLRPPLTAVTVDKSASGISADCRTQLKWCAFAVDSDDVKRIMTAATRLHTSFV